MIIDSIHTSLLTCRILWDFKLLLSMSTKWVTIIFPRQTMFEAIVYSSSYQTRDKVELKAALFMSADSLSSQSLIRSTFEPIWLEPKTHRFEMRPNPSLLLFIVANRILRVSFWLVASAQARAVGGSVAMVTARQRWLDALLICCLLIAICLKIYYFRRLNLVNKFLFWKYPRMEMSLLNCIKDKCPGYWILRLSLRVISFNCFVYVIFALLFTL